MNAHRFSPDPSTFAVAGTAAQECSPDVTSDGKWVAYQSDQSGRNEIYVRAPSADAATSWQVSTAGGSSPRWSERGDELYFLSASREIMAVSVSPAAGFRFGATRRLFPLDSLSFWEGGLLPDGRGFVIVRRRLEASGQVMMVQNFFAYLEQAVGR